MDIGDSIDKEEVETIERMAHYAYLTIDEPDDFGILFDKGVKRLLIDLSGRTSIYKKMEKSFEELGMKLMNHKFVEVKRSDLEVKNKNDLFDILNDYRKNGAANLFAIKLVVEWNNGDMQEWKRVVMYTKDKEINRDSNSGRLNVLAIEFPFDQSEKLMNKYGADLVNYTKCLYVETKTKKRICIGTMTGAI
jgi:hypothetical protein